MATLEIVVKGRDDGGSSLFNKIGGALGNMAQIAGGFIAANLFGKIADGVSSLFTSSIAEAREAVAVNKQLEQVLKSTGGAAGITAESARDLASSLQDVTNFSADAVLETENLLLTFTNIGASDGIFARTTEMALDMAQALGGEPRQAAMQLGKALNDPIEGLSALTRVGVTFTEEQEKTIKAMMETGNVAGAQAVMLAELEREFGGSARALADPVIQLQNAWDDLKESIGMAVLPLLTDLATRALPLVQDAMETIQPFLNGFQTFFSGLAEGKSFVDSLAIALLQLGVSAETVGSMITFFNSLSTTIQGGWPAIQAVLAGWATQFWGWLTGPGGAMEQAGPMFNQLLDGINAWLVTGWPRIQVALTEWSNQFWNWLTGPGGAMERSGAALSQLLTGIQEWVTTNQVQLQQLGSNLGDFLIDGLITSGSNQQKMNVLMGNLVLGIGQAALTIGSIVQDIGAAIATGLIEGIIRKLTGAEVSAQVGAAIQGAMSGLNPMTAISAGAPGAIAAANVPGVGQGLATTNDAIASALANLSNAIMGTQAAPPQTIVNVTLDSAPIAATISQSVGARVQQIRRAGAAGNF